jgi:ADP-heptose:LPS heptosyltransferase
VDLIVVAGPMRAIASFDPGRPVLELRASVGRGSRTQQYLAQVAAAGIEVANVPVPTRPVVTAGEVATALPVELRDRPSPRTCFLIGASAVMKQWPVECFAALGRRLPGTPFVLRHAPEAARVDALAERCPGLVVLEDRPLVDLVPLLAACDLVVGNDTGPLHLAAAVGTRVVGLYGGTDPDYFAPLGPESSTLGGTSSWHPGAEEVIRHLPAGRVLAHLARRFPELLPDP